MKNFLLISFLLFFCRLTAQIEGVITNQNTKQPIPYANIWVENENIGTTSSTDGHFWIKENVKNKQLFVSAIGYESAICSINNSNLEIKMVPKVYELSEVKVIPKKANRVVIGNIKKQKKSTIGSTIPWIFTRYISYNEMQNEGSYIESVKLMTESKIESAIFNFRIFSAGKSKEPGEDILKQNLIVKVKKGKSYPVINLSEYKIQIPKEGLYIAVEWITTKENGVKVKNPDENVEQTIYKYQPNFGLELKKSIVNRWYFTNAKWCKNEFKFNGKFGQLAAEITLSD